jgi:transmembrane sensor
MKPTPPCEIDEEILTQAAHWCMRLQDHTCTIAERLEFQQWIQLDPLHPFEYAKMLEIWDATGQLPSTERTLKKTAERSLATAAWHSKNLISDER